jgi:hypothetical protein
MLEECFQDVLALLLEGLLLSLLRQLIAFLRPPSLFQPGYLVKLVCFFPIMEFEALLHALADDLVDFFDDGIALEAEDLAHIHVVDIAHDLALHHRAARVVLDVPPPTRLWHVPVLVEALLLEELYGIVVSICEEVLNALFLRVILQLVHQSGA